MNATLKGCAIAATMFGALALSAPPAPAPLKVSHFFTAARGDAPRYFLCFA
jgi:hypothetical protein